MPNLRCNKEVIKQTGRPAGNRRNFTLHSTTTTTTTTTTATVLRPFVRDYPGEPVPEETFTHPPSWSSSSLYQLLPFTTIHSTLPVQITCSCFLHNLSPCPLYIAYISENVKSRERFLEVERRLTLCTDQFICQTSLYKRTTSTGNARRRFLTTTSWQVTSSRSICGKGHATLTLRRESKTGCHPNHGYNFVNSWSIFKILSPLQRAVNFQQNQY